MFLLALTITAEIAQLAGVFDVAAHAIARRARHRVVLLWLLFAALAVLSTIVTNLDTTAVLLLPVSNLTNLLAVRRFEDLGAGHGDYVRAAALPADPHDRVLLVIAGWPERSTCCASPGPRP